MDDFTAELLATHTPDPPSVTATTINAASSNAAVSSAAPTPSSRPSSSSGSTATAAPDTPTPSRTARIRDRVAAFREKANVQDKLLEKLLQRFIPAEYGGGDDPYASAGSAATNGGGGARARNLAENPSSDPNVNVPVPGEDRPGFHIATMSANFRRFNARIGSVFHFQAQAFEVLAWKQPSHTLSLLAVYTFVCMDPSLLAALPLALGVFGIFVPAFIARHPASSSSAAGDDGEMSPGLVRYSVNGPPIAPAITVMPVKELSKDFFRNMRDLQNCMEDFTRAHDAVVTTVIPLTNFGDEALSSALCVLAVVACFLMLVGSHLLPWRLFFLVGGWAAIVSGHPVVARWLAQMQEENISPDAKEEARSWLDAWVARDMILDSAPQTREVEVFELQRSTSAGLFGGGGGGLGSGEWEPWLFAPSPYDPLSHARLAGERPRGTRFFEDVLPPEGWEWSEKKWALDLWSREWVEERIITGVEVETEGERWVYDMFDERDGHGRHYDDDDGGGTRSKRTVPGPSWEEGSDDGGRRGDWRRRRWVRLVKRKKISASTVG